MTSDKRGFHFLVGLATLWLTWRLYREGIIFNAAAMAVGVEYVPAYNAPVFEGPGAVLVAVIIETIIAVGWVTVLVVTGLWDAMYSTWLLVRDALKTAQQYLYTAAKSRQLDIKAKQAEPKPADAQPVAPEQPAPKSPAEAILLALADTRAQNEAQEKAIIDITQTLASITQTLESLKSEPPKPQTRGRAKSAKTSE